MCSVLCCNPQGPLQQATHAQIYQLQQQLNQAINTKQQDIDEVYQVGLLATQHTQHKAALASGESVLTG